MRAEVPTLGLGSPGLSRVETWESEGKDPTEPANLGPQEDGLRQECLEGVSGQGYHLRVRYAELSEADPTQWKGPGLRTD